MALAKQAVGDMVTMLLAMPLMARPWGLPVSWRL